MPHILQISSGQGPAECRRFVPLLAEIIRREAVRSGVSCVPLSEYSAKDEQLASLRFAVDGEALASFRAGVGGDRPVDLEERHPSALAAQKLVRQGFLLRL